jgi:outer membrane beta-barrel protein
MRRTMLKFFSMAAALVLGTAAAPVLAESGASSDSGQVIQPELNRRDIRIPHIKASDYEIGAYTGIMSVENFGSSLVYGLRAAYHVSEDYFAQVDIGHTTVTDEAFCNVGFCPFPQRQEGLTYLAMSLGYNIFPSEMYFGGNRAVNSAVYVLTGVGATRFLEENRFTFNVGLGFRVLPRDWLDLHLVIRDYLFSLDLLGTNRITNNFEVTGGIAVYF